MSIETNKKTVRRFFEQFNHHNLDIVDQICAADYVLDFPGGPGTVHGPDGLREAMTGWLAAFPDTNYVVEDLVAEGDRVACRWSMTATHNGPLRNPKGDEIPATGKSVHFGGISLFRLRDGKLVEDRVRADMIGAMQQMGLIPSP